MSRAPLLVLLSFFAVTGTAAAATTFVPDTYSDQLPADCAPGHGAGTCSLREAVNEAQDGDTIQLGEGTYGLLLDQLLVTHDVTFVGAGPAKTTIQQQASGKRVVEFDDGSSASMTGLTITGGNLVGGDGGTGTSGHPIGFNGNGAFGGAIDSHGTALSLTLVDIVGNTATGGNGGNAYGASVAAGGDGGSASGAAIEASSLLSLDRVTIAGNRSQGGNGGNGASASGSGTGGAGGKGGPGSGAITGGYGLILTGHDTTIADNKAFAGTGGTGGLGGTSSGTGGAGGRSVRGAGGAIFTNGQLTLVNVTIAGNELHGGTGGKGGGGGIGGTGGAGGYAEGGDSGGVAMFNASSPTVHRFASVTIAGNGAFAGHGGAGGSGFVTGVAGVSASAQAGNYDVYGDKETLEIRTSVISDGIASASSANCSIGGGGAVISKGFNSDSLNQCIPAPIAGDLHGIDPMLGPLQDNGGPTRTMAPLPGSPVIDGGPSACSNVSDEPLATDQRGDPRGTPCDIGAYEAIAPGNAMPPAVSGSATTGQTVTCAGAVFTGDLPQTIDTVWLRDGQQVAAGGDYTIPGGDAGHALGCRQTATNAYGSTIADSAAVQVTAAPPPPAGSVVLSKLRVRKGKVTFTLSAPSRVRFSLCRFKGSTKVCKRVKKRAPRAVSGKQGANRTRLKLKRLRPGRYRLTATPAGGKAKRAPFRVKRRR